MLRRNGCLLEANIESIELAVVVDFIELPRNNKRKRLPLQSGRFAIEWATLASAASRWPCIVDMLTSGVTVYVYYFWEVL